jgi:DNA invertase Pin-like site-specific DNA recombinase
VDLTAYLRVSSKGQADDGFGLDVQERTIRSWAKDNGHRVVAVHTDVITGTSSVVERPGLTEAMADLRPPPKATGLVVARLDRLGRKLTQQEAILGAAWATGGNVFTVDGGEVLRDDPDDPMRTAVRQILGTMAELDRAQIAKRLRDGRKAKAARGQHAEGDYAFGYRGEGKGRDRDAVHDETEQMVIRRIVDLRRQEASYRAIAAKLNAEGLRPRRAESWSAMSVRNVAVREMGVPT